LSPPLFNRLLMKLSAFIIRTLMRRRVLSLRAFKRLSISSSRKTLVKVRFFASLPFKTVFSSTGMRGRVKATRYTITPKEIIKAV